MVHHPKLKAYSLDLREKIVAAVRRGMSKAQAARTFGVGATSLKRYVRLDEQGKALSPGKAPGRKGKLDPSGMKLLEEDPHARPAATYEERADLLLCELLGVRVSTRRPSGGWSSTSATLAKKDRWVQQKETSG